MGEVELGGNSYEISAVNLEGNPTVSMAISQLGGSNALVVSDGVKQVIEEFKEKMPVGMKIEQVFDSTEFITASIEGVVGSLRDAVVLVVLILFLFCRTGKPPWCRASRSRWPWWAPSPSCSALAFRSIS